MRSLVAALSERVIISGTIGEEHQYAGRGHAVKKGTQELLCGLVDPVQVLEHQDLRTSLRRAQEIPPQRIEDLDAPQPRIHCGNRTARIDAEQMAQVRKRGRQLLTQRQHRVLYLLDDICLGVGLFDTKKPSQHVDQRMERHRAARRTGRVPRTR